MTDCKDMANRSYDHLCGLAHSLDLVGGRWSLLLVRELLTGPKRYRDLVQRLPGLGSNLLSTRLKHLRTHGLIALERLPPPASTHAYVITEKGRTLEPIVVALAQWGCANLERHTDNKVFVPGAAILAIQANFNAEAFVGIEEAYEFHIGANVFHMRVTQVALTPRLGSAYAPDCTVHLDPDTFQRILTGRVTAANAVRQGLLQVHGPIDVRHRCLSLLDFVPLRQGRRVPMVDLTRNARLFPA